MHRKDRKWRRVSRLEKSVSNLWMVKRQLQKEFGIQKEKEKSSGSHFATFNWQINFTAGDDVFFGLCQTDWCWISSALCLTGAPTCWQSATPWRGNWPGLRLCSGDCSKSATRLFYSETFKKAVCYLLSKHCSFTLDWFKSHGDYISEDISEPFIPQRFKLQVWQSSPHLLYFEFLCNSGDFAVSYLKPAVSGFWIQGFWGHRFSKNHKFTTWWGLLGSTRSLGSGAHLYLLNYLHHCSSPGYL